jgi:hypothetical protein
MVENRLGLGYAVSVARFHYGCPAMDVAVAIEVEKSVPF